MNVDLLTGVARFNVADSRRNWSEMLVNLRRKKKGKYVYLHLLSILLCNGLSVI